LREISGEDMHTRKIRITQVAFAIVTLLTFSPLVLPIGTPTPFVMGLPRTLWAGIGISVVMATLITIIAVLKYNQLVVDDEKKA
jgi:hypothetical protein